MSYKPRYATVRKYAARELVSRDFQYAVFGARVQTDSSKPELILATTPKDIVYFVDYSSFKSFVDKIYNEFPKVVDVCSVYRGGWR